MHRAGTEAERLELPKRHDTMLTLGQLGDHPIRRTTLHFPAYMAGFDKSLLHCPSVTGRGAHEGDECYGTATTPLRSATRETMSPMILLTSKSFGV